MRHRPILCRAIFLGHSFGEGGWRGGRLGGQGVGGRRPAVGGGEMVNPNGWGPRGDGGGLRGWGPEGCGCEGCGSPNLALFVPLPLHFSSCLFSGRRGGSSRRIVATVAAMDHPKCAFGLHVRVETILLLSHNGCGKVYG